MGVSGNVLHPCRFAPPGVVRRTQAAPGSPMLSEEWAATLEKDTPATRPWRMSLNAGPPLLPAGDGRQEQAVTG